MLMGKARNRPSISNCHTIVLIECWWVQPETGSPCLHTHFNFKRLTGQVQAYYQFVSIDGVGLVGYLIKITASWKLVKPERYTCL